MLGQASDDVQVFSQELQLSVDTGLTDHIATEFEFLSFLASAQSVKTIAVAAAGQMNVSRPTFGRLLDAAHKKVAEAIVDSKQLCIQGGIRSLCDSLPTDRPDICVCPECRFELPYL